MLSDVPADRQPVMAGGAVVRAFARSIRLELFVGWVGAVAVVAVILPVEPQAIPFRLGLSAEPWPFVLPLMAAGAAVSLQPVGPELVAAVPRPAWLGRLMVTSSVMGIAAVACVAAAGAIDRPLDVVLRNVGLCLAAAFATATAAGAAISWLPPLAIVAINWLYGLTDRGQPRSWAWLQHGQDGSLTAVSLVLCLIAALAWTVLGELRRREYEGGRS